MGKRLPPALYNHGVFVHTARIVENVVGRDFLNDSLAEIFVKYSLKCGRFCIQKYCSNPSEYKRCRNTARLISAIVIWSQHSQAFVDSEIENHSVPVSFSIWLNSLPFFASSASISVKTESTASIRTMNSSRLAMIARFFSWNCAFLRKFSAWIGLTLAYCSNTELIFESFSVNGRCFTF